MVADPCAIDGCANLAAPRASLCWGHLKRRRRQLPLEPNLRAYGLTPHQHLERAAVELADAGTDSAYRAIKRRLQKWARAIGGR